VPLPAVGGWRYARTSGLACWQAAAQTIKTLASALRLAWPCLAGASTPQSLYLFVSSP